MLAIRKLNSLNIAMPLQARRDPRISTNARVVESKSFPATKKEKAADVSSFGRAIATEAFS